MDRTQYNKTGKTLKINLEYYSILIIVYIIKLLPLGFAHSLIGAISLPLYFLDIPFDKSITIKNLLHSKVAKNTREAKKLSQKSFNSMGKLFIELIKSDQYVTPENIHKHITVNADQKAWNALKDPRGVIYASAHFGNWEILGLVALLNKPVLSVMRPLNNPKINKYLFDKRNRFGQQLCNEKGAVKKLLRALEMKKTVGLLADQCFNKKQGTKTLFFKYPKLMQTTPAYLHLKTGAPLILALCRRLDNNFNYEIILRGPFQIKPTGNLKIDIKQLTQIYAEELEKIVEKYPEQWVWAFSHWPDTKHSTFP